MVNARPAAVMTPVLAGPLLGATVNPTVPSPVPVEPDVTVTHEESLVALHGQPPLLELTATVPEEPAAGMSAEDVPRVYEHPLA